MKEIIMQQTVALMCKSQEDLNKLLETYEQKESNGFIYLIKYNK